MAHALNDLVAVGLANPFTAEQQRLLKRVLGHAWVDDRHEQVLVRKVSVPRDHNFERWAELLEQAMHAAKREQVEPRTWAAAMMMLGFVKFRAPLREVILKLEAGTESRVDAYEKYVAFWQQWARPGLPFQEAHAFALTFQLQRAFDTLFDQLVGGASEAARVRAEAWESIFTRDLMRYAELLSNRMGRFATLIVGPTGSGKDVIATALGHSRFVPFDSNARRFVANPFTLHQAINVAGFAPTLVESELFGHVKGAYTGAIASRTGWLEKAGEWGSVFLDEIGELDPSLQVKLLRVLQNRTFSRLGETTERRFDGKVIAATNRDLGAAQEAGTFRSDLFFRLNSDVIRSPTLSAQLREDPTELDDLVRFIATREVGENAGAVDELTHEATSFIRAQLPDYDWPGNFRELEQCVRNILVRGAYQVRLPGSAQGPSALLTAMERALEDDSLGFDGVQGAACYAARRKHGTWVDAAKQLGLDRRTVQRKAVEWARKAGLPPLE